MTRGEFEKLVAEGIEAIPERFLRFFIVQGMFWTWR